MNKTFKGEVFASAMMLTTFFSVCILCSFTNIINQHVFVNLCNDLSGSAERIEIDLSDKSYYSPLTLETDACGSAVNLPNNTFDSGTNVGSTAEVGEPTGIHPLERDPGIARARFLFLPHRERTQRKLSA